MSGTTTDTETEASVGNGADNGPETPTDERREQMLAVFTEALGDQVVGSHITPERELWVRVERDAWVAAAELAKASLGCTFFDFLSAIDWMASPWGRYEYSVVDLEEGMPRPDPSAPIATGYAGGDVRFQVFCRLANLREHRSVILKTDLPDDDQHVASLVGVFAGANWHERECWEMFGIIFEGHPSLRHLYLPGAFEGHPLRKDFPLLARLVKPWPGIVDVEPLPLGGDNEVAGENEAADNGSAGADAAPDGDNRGVEGAGGGGEAALPEAGNDA